MRSATAEELRLAALRQLIFEEPVSRLARVKKTVQRQLTRSTRDSVKELSVFQLAELHGRIFCPDNIGKSSLIVSLVVSLALILEDFRLYTPAAFSAFIASNALLLQGQDFIGNGRAAAIFELSKKLAEDLALGPERSRWLTVGLLSTIDWPAAVSARFGAKASDEEASEDVLTILACSRAAIARSNRCCVDRRAGRQK